MLGITIPGVKESEVWNEITEEFDRVAGSPDTTLLLQHSLVSLSKWEQITEKPFLGKGEKTREDTILYIKCMNTSPVSSEDIYERLSEDNLKAISTYIDAKMTASTFHDTPGNSNTSGEFITSETIYYWMISLKVPIEFQHWHLNKLLALIKMINLKNAPTKKMSRRETMAHHRALNEQRRAQGNTRG